MGDKASASKGSRYHARRGDLCAARATRHQMAMETTEMTGNCLIVGTEGLLIAERAWPGISARPGSG